MKSLVTPFRVDGGKIATTSDASVALEQKITDVLVTNAFERPMLPEYGANLRSILFEPIDELVAADFKNDAAQEIASRVSSIDVVDMAVYQDSDDVSVVHIDVQYSPPLAPVQTLSLSIMTGVLTEETPF
jgi:phage baseplate assembly protein W